MTRRQKILCGIVVAFAVVLGAIMVMPGAPDFVLLSAYVTVHNFMFPETISWDAKNAYLKCPGAILDPRQWPGADARRLRGDVSLRQRGRLGPEPDEGAVHPDSQHIGMSEAGLRNHRMDRSKFVLLAALTVTAMPAATPRAAQAAASLDCRRASSIVEKEICGLTAFQDLDRDIAATYAQALAALSAADADADALRADQRAWLKQRDDCGDLIHGDPPVYADVYACVRDQLTARAKRLHAILERKQFFKP